MPTLVAVLHNHFLCQMLYVFAGENEEYYEDDIEEEGEIDDGDSEDDEVADDGDDVGNEDENVIEEIEVGQSSSEQRDSSGDRHPEASVSPMTVRVSAFVLTVIEAS